MRISSTIHRSLWYSCNVKEEEGGGVVGKTKKERDDGGGDAFHLIAMSPVLALVYDYGV